MNEHKRVARVNMVERAGARGRGCRAVDQHPSRCAERRCNGHPDLGRTRRLLSQDDAGRWHRTVWQCSRSQPHRHFDRRGRVRCRRYRRQSAIAGSIQSVRLRGCLQQAQHFVFRVGLHGRGVRPDVGEVRALGRPPIATFSKFAAGESAEHRKNHEPQSAKLPLDLECAPSGGHFQAADLPVCRMC